VTVAGGLLSGFDVADGNGHRLPAAAAGVSGVAGALPPNAELTATATTTAPDGTVRRSVRSVRTDAPQHPLRATITPGDDRTVGVAQPIIVAFNSAVRDHAGAERALRVTTDRPIGDAAWHWFSDTEVQYRPKTFWPAGAKVSVTARLDGVRTGETTWGVKNTTSSFTIGRSQVLRIDAAKHTMTVVRDGKDIRSVPVSLGQNKGTWRTRSGIKTIMAVERTVHMDSRTVGIDGSDAYNEDVPYAMRLTWSGEYVHAAPWSEWAQGKQDVSHGCTNVSMVNGKWLFENSLVGDPVVTTGTSRAMESGNGWGGGWNLGWADWKAGSALS
jgi:lipoprotein-anchoring transpeptidase ErfK/SrfK